MALLIKVITVIEVQIPTEHGYLSGVLHRPDGGGNCALVICHGFRGSKDGGGKAVQLANEAAKLGIFVLRFDFTPLQSLSHQISEVGYAVDYCRRFVPRVLLLGRSMGGSASLVFAAKDKNIAGLCLWATPCNLHATFRLALGEGYDKLVRGERLYICDNYGKLELGPEFLHDLSRHELLGTLQSLPPIPILIVHGNQDEIVPLSQAHALYEQAMPPKDLVVIDGADHHFTGHSEQAIEATLRWLKMWFCSGSI